jgi:threonine synthase
MFRRLTLQCSDCNKTLPIDKWRTTCPECHGQLTIVHDLKAISTALEKNAFERRGPGVWKYFELLPVHTMSSIVSLGEGGTFLQKCDGLAKALGVKELYVKNETTNPTGSFIDRGMTVLMSKAVEADMKSLSCVPTGNLGASLAAYATKAGVTCKILLSSEIDLGKLYQMIAYNADIQLDDNGEKGLASNDGHDFRVTPSNPFLIEGEKTIAYEMCEQRGWHPPSRIISPMGTGGLTSMIWRGLQDLTQLGFIDYASSMITGVQAEGCCPIVEAYRNKRSMVESFHEPKTIAVDIKVGNPPLGEMALAAIRASKGDAIAVSDSEILEAIRLLAKTEGVFAEPSAASTIAGLKKLIRLGETAKDEAFVCVITGAGLKDPSIIESLVEDQRRVKLFVHGVEGRRLTRLGETKLQILRVLSDGELHGYGIWKTLREERSLKITLPSVYQHLSELEALTLVRKSEAQPIIGGRVRRYYRLMEKGKDALR